MGNRLSKIYTRTGDDGTTGLFDASRVPKDNLRVAAFGEIDELNSGLGLAAATIRADHTGREWDTLRERIATIQSELFTLGAELATPPSADPARQSRIPHITPAQSARLEKWIDDACAPVPPLTTFILPAGPVVTCCLHMCRTVSRRAERAVVTLARTESVNPEVLIYLNRLSDLLFAWARYSGHLAGAAETQWIPPTP